MSSGNSKVLAEMERLKDTAAEIGVSMEEMASRAGEIADNAKVSSSLAEGTRNAIVEAHGVTDKFKI
jgi:methyl-accepting chemotaxis protein